MESICYDSMIPIYESIKGICLGLGVGAFGYHGSLYDWHT